VSLNNKSFIGALLVLCFIHWQATRSCEWMASTCES